MFALAALVAAGARPAGAADFCAAFNAVWDDRHNAFHNVAGKFLGTEFGVKLFEAKVALPWDAECRIEDDPDLKESNYLCQWETPDVTRAKARENAKALKRMIESCGVGMKLLTETKDDGGISYTNYLDTADPNKADIFVSSDSSPFTGWQSSMEVTIATP